MSDHVYKKIELVGSSPTSIEEAVQNALARAQQTIRNMRWFEVTENAWPHRRRQGQPLAGDREGRLHAR
jgi:hypothetical protein